MVAGGGDPTDWVLDDVNFYNPAADAWNRGASLSTVRIMHSATLLPDGKVLIVGGFDYTGVLGSTEVYDPASGESAPSNDLVTGRAMHAATLLSDGAVLVTGGVGNDYGTLAASEIFVPRTRQSHP
jgi:N-acetylneuraminic acid mutarotase